MSDLLVLMGAPPPTIERTRPPTKATKPGVESTRKPPPPEARPSTNAPTDAERRRFTMHEELLFSVITRQAGTLGKAVLESVMNSLDAGATTVEIEIDQQRVSVVDDGAGFKSRDEIEQFFEVFGTPHKEGDARFGQFRMGRGQNFAFGKNHWHSNCFRMNIDIKNQGLDYELITTNDVRKGCEVAIELYERLSVSQLDQIVLDVTAWTAWTGVTTTLNGRLISKDPAKEQWDEETDDAYLRFDSRSPLAIYNMGVFVSEQGSCRYGTGGMVVSKQRLKVNFARNDVQSDCKVWRRIEAVIREKAGTKVAAKVRVTDGERDYLAKRLRSGEEPLTSCLNYKVFTDVDGKHHGLTRILWRTRFLSAGAKNDKLAKAAQNQDPAVLVMAPETLKRFAVDSVEDLLAALRTAMKRQQATHYLGMLEKIVAIPLDQLTAKMSSRHEDIATKDLTTTQKAAIDAVSCGLAAITRIMTEAAGGVHLPRREIRLGKSEHADAWTNGSTTIWLNQKWVAQIGRGMPGCARIAALLVHEMLHGEADTETQEHDHEFYEQFHDLVIDTDLVGKGAANIMTKINQRVRAEGRKPGGGAAVFETLQDSITHASGNKEDTR